MADGCQKPNLINPVKLPCGHLICTQCLSEWSIEGKCLVKDCRVQIPPDILKDPQKLIPRLARKRLTNFQICCNRFLSDIIEALTFYNAAGSGIRIFFAKI